MCLCLVLRSYGGENDKGRPDWFDKDLTVASFLRSAHVARDAGVAVRVVFANDGPIPQHRLAVMQAEGEVVGTEGGPVGLLDSYRFALDLPGTLGLADSDVIAYVEDDYLLTAGAFVALAEAVEALPEADYFALAGTRPDDLGDPEQRRSHGAPRDWRPEPDHLVGDRRWVHIMSTTSTFAARVGALRVDRGIHELALKPFRSRFLDHELCLMYQGVVPYHGREYVFGLGDDFVPGLRGVLRAVYLLPMRVAVNRAARRRRPQPHRLWAPSPQEAAHCEIDCIPEGHDWAREAADVRAWAAEHAH